MNPKIDYIQNELNKFPEKFSSIVISTLTTDNLPYTSYAPFVIYNNDYYFIISKIAKHYENLVAHPAANIMLIEDEFKATNIFFRKRLSYAITTTLDIQEEAVKNQFIRQYGDMVNMLFKMDFLVVKSNIKEGLIVLGAGQAYEIDKQQQIISQVTNPKGHGKK